MEPEFKRCVLFNIFCIFTKIPFESGRVIEVVKKTIPLENKAQIKTKFHTFCIVQL